MEQVVEPATEPGPRLALEESGGQAATKTFLFPTPQIASLYVTAGKLSSLDDVKNAKVPLPTFLEEINQASPNAIINQALVLLDGSLPMGGQVTGIGRLHSVFKITMLPGRIALETRDCGMVKMDARQPLNFASRTRIFRAGKLITVQPDTWVELHDDDIMQMGSTNAFKYRVFIPLPIIHAPEMVASSKPHLIKLAIPSSCIARLIGVKGRTIQSLQETFKCTITSANQGVYVQGLELIQARKFSIYADSYTRLIDSLKEVLRVSQIPEDPAGLYLILPVSTMDTLQGSQGRGLQQLGARADARVHRHADNLLQSQGNLDSLIHVVRHIIEILGPMPSGYEADDASEQGVQRQKQDRNVRLVGALTPPGRVAFLGHRTPHVLERHKTHHHDKKRDKGRIHTKNVEMKKHNKDGRKKRASLGVSKRRQDYTYAPVIRSQKKIVAQILQQRETYDRPTLPVY